MSKITYRFAAPGDVETLVELRLAFLAEAKQDVAGTSGLSEGIRGYFATTLPQERYAAALAEAEGGAVGVCGVVFNRHPPSVKYPTGLSPYVMNMYVVPEYRRQGIATQLLHHIIAKVRESGANIVTLHYWPGKIELYEKNGFKLREREMELGL